MSHRPDIIKSSEGSHEASWSDNETESVRQKFEAMSSSSTLDDQDGGERQSGWGFEFDIEAMKKSTSGRAKHHYNMSEEYHNGGQWSIDRQRVDREWLTEREHVVADSSVGYPPLPEVAWEYRPELERQNNYHEERPNPLHHDLQQYDQQQYRKIYQEHPMRHEHINHTLHRNINSEYHRQGAGSSPHRNSHSDWYSRESGDGESNPRHADHRGDRKTDDMEDDVWGLKRTEQWTALQDDVMVEEKEEVELDELTKYWAPSNILELIRPNRAQQMFSNTHNRHGGQVYGGDNWGDVPEPSMTYNGEYTNTVLVEQRNKEYWAMQDGKWILLNSSSGMMVTPQKKGDNPSVSDGDNDIGDDNGQTSEDISDNYSQGWSDYHPEDSSSTPSVDHELEDKRCNRVHPTPVPKTDYLSKVRQKNSPVQFNLDAGFIPEDEWRKPLSERAKKQDAGSIQAINGLDGSWKSERTSWERPASQASLFSESGSAHNVSSDVLPNFSSAKPSEQPTSTQTSNIITIDSAKKTPVVTSDFQLELLVDLDDSVPRESHPSSTNFSMVESLAGLNFTKNSDDDQRKIISPLDGTDIASTEKISVTEMNIRDEHKGEKNENLPLVVLTSRNVDNTHSSADFLISNGIPTLDLLELDIQAQESTEINNSQDLLETTTILSQVFTKKESHEDLLTSTNSLQEPPTTNAIPSTLTPTSLTQMSAQKRLISKEGVPSEIFDERSSSTAKSLSSANYLDDLGSPYDWLNQIASRIVRQSEQSRATQQEQWNALMAKQEEDSNRIQDFINKTTAATPTANSVSHTSVYPKKTSKPKMPFSLAMAVETRDHGQQILNVTENDDLKDVVERFCTKYDMQSYEMALWVTVAKAIKKKKKQQRMNNKQQ
ncbi:hypothetical protein FBU30_001777 [Linnemannia zychae]|nr:hypothetical protein FBU30_001777 [Linnemannia zychae]